MQMTEENWQYCKFLILLNKSETYSSKKQKMRKINSIITLMVIILITNASIAQTIHDAKVQGIISIGNKDISSILDLNTGDRYKTTNYKKNQNILKSSF